MAKYRKKPVVVDVWRLPGVLDGAYTGAAPQWVWDAERSGTIFLDNGQCFIKTLEGDMEAHVGDFIIRGIKGEIYPCRPDLFAATYEEAEE